MLNIVLMVVALVILLILTNAVLVAWGKRSQTHLQQRTLDHARHKRRRKPR